MSQHVMANLSVGPAADLYDLTQSTQKAAHIFRDNLDQLGLSQRSLAAKMREIGDNRTPDAILRSIHRMANGKAKVSGEMQVIMKLLLKNRLRAGRVIECTNWLEGPGRTITAEVEGVALSLSPQSVGCWKVHAQQVDAEGVTASSVEIRGTLEEAKLRAIQCVDEIHDNGISGSRVRSFIRV